MKTFKQFISQMNEDAPANAVGGGNIAALGVGSQGEPGLTRRPKVLKRKNGTVTRRSPNVKNYRY